MVSFFVYIQLNKCQVLCLRKSLSPDFVKNKITSFVDLSKLIPRSIWKTEESEHARYQPQTYVACGTT